MTKLITICIPTRNRVNTLNRNIKYLNSIIIKNELSDLVDILISDNSTIENYNKIQKFQLDHIKFIHSEDNGHDKNILNLTNASNSKYVWFCQDHTKIHEDALISICNKLKFNDIDYVFLSTKDNFSLNKIILQDKRFISFKNIYLNTNLVRLNMFKKKYNFLYKKYNQSHLVFHFSIISLCFDDNTFSIDLNLKKCSSYKYFDINDEHKKMTWSKDLSSYLSILNFSSNFYNSFINQNTQYKKQVKKIFNNFDSSIPTLYRIIQLLQKNKNIFSINNEFISHPTFNTYERLILNLIFKKKIGIIFKFPIKYILIDLYFLLILPSQYLKRFIMKFSNSFLNP